MQAVSSRVEEPKDDVRLIHGHTHDRGDALQLGGTHHLFAVGRLDRSVFPVEHNEVQPQYPRTSTSDAFGYRMKHPYTVSPFLSFSFSLFCRTRSSFGLDPPRILLRI